MHKPSTENISSNCSCLNFPRISCIFFPPTIGRVFTDNFFVVKPLTYVAYFLEFSRDAILVRFRLVLLCYNVFNRYSINATAVSDWRSKAKEWKGLFDWLKSVVDRILTNFCQTKWPTMNPTIYTYTNKRKKKHCHCTVRLF